MYRRRYETEDEGSFLMGLLQIFLGVFFGGLAAMFTYEAVVAWRVEQAAKKAVAEMERQISKTNAELAQQARQREEQRQAREREAAARQTALDMAARLERERRERKDLAWKKFFMPSPACQQDSSTAPCANEYMAARTRFEANYVDR
jgi:uncharacterized protein (DUF1800 family)